MRGMIKRGTNKLNNLRQTRRLALAVLGTLLSAPCAVAAEPLLTSPHNRTVVISLADRKLTLIEDGHLAKAYDIAVGKPRTPSPSGEMRIVNKLVQPTYYHRGVVIRPGKRNPLGRRWIGLSRPGYGIHGTNEPDSIGKAASHGCFRMRNADVEQLFTLVRVGDAVEIMP